MNILILGSGGREHALSYSISKSPRLSKLFIAPGNPGTAELGTNIPVNAEDFESVKKAVLENKIHMVIVGPEAPLVSGITDFFTDDEKLKNIKIIGPGSGGALLEGSKEFAKDFMLRHGIPTAGYKSITNINMEEGFMYLERLNPPYVLKADGLAAGKGVLIHDSVSEAQKELKDMINGKFGKASERVIIEEYLKGIELSVFVLTDGENYIMLPEAKDYKRVGEGDTGLNTGGMGAVSPVSFADDQFMKKVEEKIVRPTVEGINRDGIDYKGFLFFGLMNIDGEPYVIEYNVRMGDPEAEVILPRIKTDFIDMLEATADGKLNQLVMETDEQNACTIMLVSGGYPGKYEKGREIEGLENVQNSIIFHAGTKEQDGKILTNGGRVLAVTSLGKDMTSALQLSHANARRIDFKGKYYRTDIGFDL